MVEQSIKVYWVDKLDRGLKFGKICLFVCSAALDAYVLLEVYEALSSKVKEHNIQVNLEPPAGHSVQPRKTKLQKHQQKVAERLANARPIDVKVRKAFLEISYFDVLICHIVDD